MKTDNNNNAIKPSESTSPTPLPEVPPLGKLLAEHPEIEQKLYIQGDSSSRPNSGSGGRQIGDADHQIGNGGH